MQVQQVSPAATWASFAIEAVKILGPATLALVGSWLALRYQRRLKESELTAGITLKARELMFEAYQQKINSQTAELKELSRTFQKLSLQLEFGSQQEQMKAFHEAAGSITALMSPALSSTGVLERELTSLGLNDQYPVQLAFIRDTLSQPLKVTTVEESKEFANTCFKLVGHLTVLNQALLDKKRDLLFAEYLP